MKKTFLQGQAKHVVDARPTILVVVQDGHTETKLGQVRPLVTANLPRQKNRIYLWKPMSVLFYSCSVQHNLELGPVPRRVEVRGSLQMSVRDLVRGRRTDDVNRKLDFQELVAFTPCYL